jgi:CheY-like chemotaxis protein
MGVKFGLILNKVREVPSVFLFHYKIMKNKIHSVLLIDDSIPNNYFHKIILEKSGVALGCTAVNNGQEALDYLQSKQDAQERFPELIFVDINMPVINGWDFVEKFRANHKSVLKEVVMVMLTTSINPDDREKAERLHVSNYLAKPLTVEVLVDLYDSHFKGRT